MKYYLVAILIILMTSLSCAPGKNMPLTTQESITFIADTSLFTSRTSSFDQPASVHFSYGSVNGLRTGAFRFYKGDTVKIDIHKPVYLARLNSAGCMNKIYPGESVLLKYAEDGSMLYTVNNKARNNELLFYHLVQNGYLNIHGELLTRYYRNDSTALLSVGVTEDNMAAFLNDLSKGQQRLIDSLYRFYLPDAAFMRDIKHTQLADSLFQRFFLYQKLAEQTNHTVVSKDTLIQLFKSLDSISHTTDFSFFQGYTDQLFKQVWKGEGLSSGIVRSKRDLSHLYKLAIEYSSGHPRDYILSTLLYSALCRRVRTPVKYLKDYYRTCMTKEYEAEVRLKRMQVKRLSGIRMFKSSNILLPANADSATTIQKEIKKFRGSLILLDIWASWCMPCQEDMPFWAKLEEKYKGKPLHFIKISTDKNIDAWKDALSQEEIRKGNNFVFANFGRSSFHKKYQVMTVPRYILIGKDGTLINDKAPSPNDPELEKLLDSHLY